MIREKTCCRCKILKPTTEYYKSSAHAIGIRYSCKECDRQKEGEQKNKDKSSFVKSRKKCSSCLLIKNIEDFGKRSRTKDGYSYKCIKCSKSQSFYDTYGVSESLKMEMIKSQNNKCAICNKVMTRPHIDHNHFTGKIRDILCYGCNSGIGFFYEDIQNLFRAIEYLGEYQ